MRGNQSINQWTIKPPLRSAAGRQWSVPDITVFCWAKSGRPETSESHPVLALGSDLRPGLDSGWKSLAAAGVVERAGAVAEAIRDVASSTPDNGWPLRNRAGSSDRRDPLP